MVINFIKSHDCGLCLNLERIWTLIENVFINVKTCRYHHQSKGRLRQLQTWYGITVFFWEKKKFSQKIWTWILLKYFHWAFILLPTITTGEGIKARFWESATTRLLESFSSGIMWAEPSTDSVATRTKQLSKRKPCIFLWNNITERKRHTVSGWLVLDLGENQVFVPLALITSVFSPQSISCHLTLTN